MEENKIIDFPISKEINEEFENGLEDIFELVGLEDKDQEALVSLLQMDDESFNEIAPSVLAVLKDGIEKEEFKYIIQHLINTQNLNSYDIEETLKVIKEEIDKNEILTQPKKDFLTVLFSIILGKFAEVALVEDRIVIPIEKTSSEINIPVYAKPGDAGMDIYATEDITIKPGETKILSTGLKVAIPKGYAILIQPRSGLSAKTKLRIANTPGLIDSGYRDEIGVIIENINSPIKEIESHYEKDGKLIIDSILYGEEYNIEKDMRIAQMRLVKVPEIMFQEVNSIKNIGVDRGGGFGSTGI